MQPQQIKGFNYAPIAITPYQDPWAAYRLALQAKEEEERRRQEIEKARGKKGSGNQGIASSLISEGGAIGGGVLGGAAGGALAGSAILPGLGTLAGGIIGAGVGAFAGGTGGRLIENQVRDNEMRLGDALKEGAVAGAFSAGGVAAKPLWGLAKGARLAKGASAADDAIRVATGAKGAAVGKLELGGRGLRAGAMGVGPGSKAPGMARPLGASESDDILQTLKSFGIRSTSPEKAQRALQPKLNELGNQLGQAYKTAGARFTDDELLSLADDIVKTVGDDASLNLTGSARQAFDKQIGQILKPGATAEDLWKIQKDLSKSINFGKTASSRLVDREAVARVIRQKIGERLSQKVPQTSAINKLYASGSTADDLFRVASKQADRQGIAAALMTSQPVRGGTAKVGGAIETVGRGLRTAGPVTRQAKYQSIPALSRAMGGGEGAPPEVPLDLASVLGTDPMSADLMGGMGDPMAGAMQQPQQQYTLQNALQEAYGLLGADQTPATYLSYAKALMEASEGAGGATANQKTAAAKAEGANRIIDELEGVFNQSGGARGPIEGRIGQLGSAMGGGNQALKSYQDLRSAYTAQISRALGEVGVLTDKDREVIQRAIPSVNDSREAAQIKLQTLRNILGQLVQQNSGGDASNDLINAIAQQVNNQGYTQ